MPSNFYTDPQGVLTADLAFCTPPGLHSLWPDVFGRRKAQHSKEHQTDPANRKSAEEGLRKRADPHFEDPQSSLIFEPLSSLGDCLYINVFLAW